MIPKIIHQIAPEDPNLWHPLWKLCKKSWERNFSNFEHILWSDKKDIDKLVKEDYPQYFDLYQSFDRHILKIDFARFCILHKYGGIYADMDMYCYKNFYDELKINAVYLNEASNDEEKVENSMMISPPNCNFYLECMELCKERYEFIIENRKKYPNSYKFKNYTINISGPTLLTDVYLNHNEKIYILPRKLYNNELDTYDESYYTKHMLTGIWGEEILNLILQDGYENGLNDPQEIFKWQYNNFRGIDLNQLNFCKNYKVDENFTVPLSDDVC